MTTLTPPWGSPKPGELPDSVFVVAEIGINHNGEMALVKQLIDAAVDAGCDAVKFQKRDIATVYPKAVLDAPRESPWGSTQRAQKEALELSSEDYGVIDDYCRAKGILWTASAWDFLSLEFVDSYNPLFHKIASAMVTNRDFVTAVARLQRPTLVSTGMSNLDDIDFAVNEFRRHGTAFALLHTVSVYPCPLDDLNLRMIPALAARYDAVVGYSGHEASVSPSVAACCLGAQILERHITLDRTMYGSDQAASLEPNGLRQLVEIVRKLPMTWGSGLKTFSNAEREVAAKLRYWEVENG